MSEIIYILVNEAMPGMIKIGLTRAESVEARMKQLDVTGVPLPFECFYAAEVKDAGEVERAIHTAFGDHRVRPNREFFRLSPDKPKAIVKLLQIRDVTPSIDVVGEPDDREALDQAKKRAPTIRFSVLGIKPGTDLQSVFDDTITCKVKDDRRIIFRDEEDSLSGSALKIAKEKGYKWTNVDGPSYWKYNGRTLREIKDDPDGLASDDKE